MGQCGRVLGGKNKNGDCLFTMTQCFVRGLKIRNKACKKSKISSISGQFITNYKVNCNSS